MTLEITESPRIKIKISVRRSLIIALISLFIGVVIFTVAYTGMRNDAGIGELNKPILDWVLGIRNPLLTSFAQIVTSIASPLIFTIIVLTVAIIWAFTKRELWRPSLLIISVAIAAATSTALKAVTMDARPDQINMIPAFETNFSFPSGHTISMVVFMLVFGYVIYSRNYSLGRLWAWLVAALIGTGLIAASRLYLGYHWLTDVVASIGLGFIILALIIFIDLIFINHTNK